MTREEEARKRQEAANYRMRSAGRIRDYGSRMMVAGGGALAVTIALNVSEPQMPEWAGWVAVTVVVMLWLGGTAFYVGGRALKYTLAQLADDRATQEEQHEKVMGALGEIKRNQTFLKAHRAVDNAAGGHGSAKVIPLPPADSLDMMRRQRRQREELRAVGNENPEQNLHDEIREYLDRRRDDE